MRDTPILVRPDETTKLRILNVGGRTLALHTHGHHPTLTDLDGYPVPKAAQITRDTFAVAPAQRIDLALRTGADGYYASGPGVWLMHDHTPEASSNKGINPGGDHTDDRLRGLSRAPTACRSTRPAMRRTRCISIPRTTRAGGRCSIRRSSTARRRPTTRTASPIRRPAARSTIRAAPSSGRCRGST